MYINLGWLLPNPSDQDLIFSHAGINSTVIPVIEITQPNGLKNRSERATLIYSAGQELNVETKAGQLNNTIR